MPEWPRSGVKKDLCGRRENHIMKKFLKGIRSKQLLVGVLALSVIAAGYYRFAVEKEVSPVTSETLPVEEVKTSEKVAKENVFDDADYFARAKYERDCMRSENIEILSVSTVGNDNVEVLEKKIAEHEQNGKHEIAIEDSVKAKGYADCVAFVGDEGVQVIVKTETLDASGVDDIKNIIISHTGVNPTEIKVSCRP